MVMLIGTSSSQLIIIRLWSVLSGSLVATSGELDVCFNRLNENCLSGSLISYSDQMFSLGKRLSCSVIINWKMKRYTKTML